MAQPYLPKTARRVARTKMTYDSIELEPPMKGEAKGGRP